MRKKTLFVTLLFLFIISYVNSYAAVDCFCKCPKTKFDFWDNLLRGMTMADMLLVPTVATNLQMHGDGNDWMIYAMDGYMAGAVTWELLAKDKEPAVIAVSAGIGIEWIYSLVSLIKAYGDNNSGGISRGWFGVAGPWMGLAAAMLTFRCPCAPESECASFAPVVTDNYAGLDCRLRF